eukprot:m.833241 g.833241  ORF g.833241 m.833241 type:complete len:240 (-) comp59465_c0_seq50:3687-4406(-)
MTPAVFGYNFPLHSDLKQSPKQTRRAGAHQHKQPSITYLQTSASQQYSSAMSSLAAALRSPEDATGDFDRNDFDSASDSSTYSETQEAKIAPPAHSLFLGFSLLLQLLFSEDSQHDRPAPVEMECGSSSASSDSSQERPASPELAQPASERPISLTHFSKSLLELPTVELNKYMRTSNMTDADRLELRKLRRRLKNRGYSKTHREKKREHRLSEPFLEESEPKAKHSLAGVGVKLLESF